MEGASALTLLQVVDLISFYLIIIIGLGGHVANYALSDWEDYQGE